MPGYLIDSLSQTAMNIEQARFNMIEQQIRPWDVLDPSVLALLSLVKREDFVPAAYRGLAFMDTEIPLGEGQFMLPPRVEARLLQAAAIQKHEKVLEIGAGSGFMAALLAHKAQQVISLELRPSLVKMARNHLHRAGIGNAEVREADGSQPAAVGGAPFDAIVLSGSVPSVTDHLRAQLKVGGTPDRSRGQRSDHAGPARDAGVRDRVSRRETCSTP